MIQARRWARCDGKRPIMPDGSPASSTNSDTWSSFAAVQSGAGDGFGFMLGDGFGCIDLDNCLVGGVANDGARKLLRFNRGAFVERSVSGRGLHIFGWRGEAPGVKRCGFEVYSFGRFIRTTGDTYRRGKMIELKITEPMPSNEGLEYAREDLRRAADSVRRHDMLRAALVADRDKRLVAAREAGATWAELKADSGLTQGAVADGLKRGQAMG